MTNNCKPKNKSKKNVIDSLFQIECFLKKLSTTTSTLKLVKCLKKEKNKKNL